MCLCGSISAGNYWIWCCFCYQTRLDTALFVLHALLSPARRRRSSSLLIPSSACPFTSVPQASDPHHRCQWTPSEVLLSRPVCLIPIYHYYCCYSCGSRNCCSLWFIKAGAGKAARGSVCAALSCHRTASAEPIPK